MKLATLRTAGPDGALIVVSRDLSRAVSVGSVAMTLQQALDHWSDVEPKLKVIYDALNNRRAAGAFTLEPHKLEAPLPRAWQWLDGSAFLSHGALMQKAFNLPPIETDLPLMYQGLSHRFLSAHADVPLRSESDGIDFEGEFGVVTGPVPMGVGQEDALSHIRLIVQINDWSLRALGPVEMKTGFGFLQAKPACSLAPFALTPDELGGAWKDGRVIATMRVRRNGEHFGAVPATEMGFSFPELIAHAARTRDLCAGTIIGSGTVSSERHEEFGSCCISERRAIEGIKFGAPRTPFLRFGERVQMDAEFEGSAPLFGVLDQKIVAAR